MESEKIIKFFSLLQRMTASASEMVSQIGCPHFFLTLSAADMQWPELFRIIAQQNGRSLTDDDIAALSYDEKSSMLRNDPVLAARHFDHRLHHYNIDRCLRRSRSLQRRLTSCTDD